MFPTNLLTLGRSLEVDKDYPLRAVEQGQVLLINLRPQTYKPETHKVEETILALTGALTLEMATGNVRLNTGDCLTVPPGIEHCFSADSDAVILVVFG